MSKYIYVHKCIYILLNKGELQMKKERVVETEREREQYDGTAISLGPMSYLWTALLGARLYLDETAAVYTR